MKNNFLIKLIYCSPAFTFAIPTFPIMILLPQIYVVNHNLTFATIGSVLFLARIIDIFSDPLMGWVCDKNFLSRKKWIILGSLISGFSFYYLILPVNQPDAVYLFVWISLLYLGWTMCQVSYLSIGYDLESDYEKRSKLSAGREFFVLLGLLAAVSLPVFFNQSNIKSEIFLLYLAIISGLITISLFSLFLKEKKRKKKKSNILNILSILKELRQNIYLVKLLFPWFLNCLANAFPMILFVFYISSILNGTESDKEFILFIYYLSAIIGMSFWVYMIKKIDKKNIWRISMLISSLIFTSIFILNEDDIFLFSIISCLTGFCLGADLSVPPSILSDVTDYHKKKFNKDISGILFSLLIFLNKLTFAIATLIAFGILDFFDFNATDSNALFNENILVFMYAGIPIILKLFTVIKLKDFNLTKKEMANITKNLYG